MGLTDKNDKLTMKQKVLVLLFIIVLKALKVTDYNHEIDKDVTAIKDIIKLGE